MNQFFDLRSRRDRIEIIAFIKKLFFANSSGREEKETAGTTKRYYRFKAKTGSGQTQKGTIAAFNRYEALDYLYTRNLVVINLEETAKGQSNRLRTLEKILQRIGYRRYSSRDLMILCRQFATMLEAGIPLLHALDILAGQEETRAFKAGLQSAALALEQGYSLSEAFRLNELYFPSFLVHMIEAGENSGMLDRIMERLAEHYERQHDFEGKVRSATAYPLFITAVAFAVVLIMITVVLPQFASIFEAMGFDMPFYTRLLLLGGTLAREYWIVLILLSALIFCGLSSLYHSKRGRPLFDRLKLTLPLYGKIYRQILAARFARTLATLLAGGVALHSALLLVDRVLGNAVISNSIKTIGDALKEGETMAEPLLKDRHLPVLLAEMVRIGEETGALEQTLNKTALFYEKEVAYIVERLSSILEPALLLFVGLFIGLLVYSIFSPIYQIYQLF